MVDTTTFSIGLMVRESASVIEQFIDYHVAIGAHKIYIVYDGSTLDLTNVGLNLGEAIRENVVLLAADDDVWPSPEKQRPHAHNLRQEAVLKYLHSICESDWLFCIDADEFLVAQTSVAELLGSLPSSVESVNFENVEAVWGPGEDIDLEFGSTHFRRKLPSNETGRSFLKRIYGMISNLLDDKGFVGYVQGKSAHRCSSNFKVIRAHWAEKDGASVSEDANKLFENYPTITIAHFDAISFARWKKKFDIRKVVKIGGSRRRRLARVVNYAIAIGLGRFLFRRLYCLTPRQLRLLEPDHVLQKDIFSAHRHVTVRETR